MERKIHLLLISPHFFPYNRYEQELYTHLLQEFENITVTVLCYNTTKSPPRESYNGIEIYRVPCIDILPGQFVIPNYFQLIKTLEKIKKEQGIDIINCDTRFFDSTWWTPYLARFWKVPAIFTDHTASHPRHESAIIRFITKTLDRYFIPFFLRKYSAVTVTSRAAQLFLQNNCGIDNAVVIRTGVDSNFFTPQKREKKIRHLPNINRDFTETDILITAGGRLIPSKGFLNLYLAIKPLFQRYPNIFLLIAGIGPEAQRIKKLLIKDNLQQRVFFTGFLNKEAISILLANSDIFVHPSLHHEGFPNILLEAGASKCTVLATAQGATTELIINGATGLIIDIENTREFQEKLEKVINNKKLRLLLSAALFDKIISEYSWLQSCQLFHQLIRKVLP